MPNYSFIDKKCLLKNVYLGRNTIIQTHIRKPTQHGQVSMKIVSNPILFQAYYTKLFWKFMFFIATSEKEFNCDNQTPPPSSLNKVCVEFNNKVSNYD